MHMEGNGELQLQLLSSLTCTMCQLLKRCDRTCLCLPMRTLGFKFSKVTQCGTARFGGSFTRRQWFPRGMFAVELTGLAKLSDTMWQQSSALYLIPKVTWSKGIRKLKPPPR